MASLIYILWIIHLLVVLVYSYLSYSHVASIYRVLTVYVVYLYHLSTVYFLSVTVRYAVKAHVLLLAVDGSLFFYGRRHHHVVVTSEMLTCEILSSMHHVLKITSSANNTLVPVLFPLPSTNNVTYMHARTCCQPRGVVL